MTDEPVEWIEESLEDGSIEPSADPADLFPQSWDKFSDATRDEIQDLLDNAAEAEIEQLGEEAAEPEA